MSIPKLNNDLNIIQKLSDLPNSSDGLTAQELKAKFDEGANMIQNWINDDLVPALTSENIPFTPTEAVDEKTIQEAIVNVQEQVRNASTGTIVNGAVTKEKLSADVQNRSYGGRVWVSLDEPSAEHNTAAGFPIGQLWLRPGVTVANKKGSWTATSGTASETEGIVTMTGDGTYTTATFTNNMADAGQQGDRVYILFHVQEKDTDISNLTVKVGIGEEQSVESGGVFSGEVLANGALSVELAATWPRLSLAKGSFQIVNFAVVNVDAILRQTNDLQAEPDWETWLSKLLPLEECVLPEKMWAQKKDGQWWPMIVDPDPSKSNLFLQYIDGKKVWSDQETAISNLASLRIATDTYTGNGEARTVTLPLVPKLLVLSPDGGPVWDDNRTGLWDNPVVLRNGGTVGASGSGRGEVSGVWSDYVSLREDQLELTGLLGNRSGKTYTWTAIY